MPGGRLPRVLDSLRISIDANGEIALDNRTYPDVRFAGPPESVVTDSQGHTYVLFAHRMASGPGRTRGDDVRRIVRAAAAIVALAAACAAVLLAVLVPLRG
jgi:hypothetical protein